MPDNLILIADFNRGQYIPQHVAQLCGTIEPINPESLDALIAAIRTLETGPDTEGYWDAWAWVLDNACVRNGRWRYGLIQDGDVWAYRLNREGRRAIRSFNQ